MSSRPWTAWVAAWDGHKVLMPGLLCSGALCGWLAGWLAAQRLAQQCCAAQAQLDDAQRQLAAATTLAEARLKEKAAADKEWAQRLSAKEKEMAGRLKDADSRARELEERGARPGETFAGLRAAAQGPARTDPCQGPLAVPAAGFMSGTSSLITHRRTELASAQHVLEVL